MSKKEYNNLLKFYADDPYYMQRLAIKLSDKGRINLALKAYQTFMDVERIMHIV